MYQGKPRKNVCILCTLHTGVGTFSGVKAVKAGINVRILFKKHQQMESPEESPAAAVRAEGRTHGGERGRGSRHKVGSSGNNQRRRQCRSERAANGTKRRTLEMPHGTCAGRARGDLTVTSDHNGSFFFFFFFFCITAAHFQVFRLLFFNLNY